MIFKRLVESLPKIPKNATLKFNKADDKTRQEIIKRVLDAFNVPNLSKNKGLFKATFDSALHYGLDTSINPWFEFIDTTKNHIKEPYSDYLPTLFKLHSKENIDLNAEFLPDEHFKNIRDVNEYSYLVKLLDTLSNPSKLSKFFKNTDVNFEELRVGNDPDAPYKPVGIGKHSDPDTIFGTVEIWSEGNEVEQQIEIGVRELRAIKQKYAGKSRDVIENELGGPNKIDDDTIIYSEHIKHNSKPTEKDLESDPHFWIWDKTNMKWQEYNTPHSKKVLRESN